MASILVIVATFVGRPIVELGKCFAEPIKRQFNYLCCFNKNVETLENESKKLEGVRVDLQSRVDTDERNAQVVDSQVKIWFEEVGEIQGKMHEIDSEITTSRNGGSIVRCRFSLSKKVRKIAEAMKELRQSGNFNSVSQPPPPAASVSIPLRSTFEFESRKQIEEEIIADLKDNKANVFGICGMGGVGKTTMAKRIMNRAREELGFEEIVMAVVSQEVDLLRIQDDIAKPLGLELAKGGNLSSRAHILHTRLTAGKKRSLIVLDDIWENIKLEDLGIPSNGDGGCKILLTSRNRDAFKRMPVEKVHAVLVLSEIEAWDLFKSNVGTCIEQENVGFIAQKVVQECKGLPIALVTVGAALKETESTSVWEGWLQQLKSSNPIDLPDVLNDVYKPLRLSYEWLKNERAKSLFLMCCLFPEDHDIPVESLTIYVMGLGMFEDTTSLVQARNRVCLLVEMLKNRFLLLEGSTKNEVKMHDVVRDVAIHIASDEKRINCNDCTWISPSTRERIKLRSTVFPNLNLLFIDGYSRDKDLEIDDHFFEGMREINVFSITYLSLQQLPQTIELLKNLRTLILVYTRSVENISVIGELANLETLICRDCYSIVSLPVEIRRLSRLRLLELSGCVNLKTIAPGIISNQKKLEVLIVEDFEDWESEITGIQGKNASLIELQQLSTLTQLKIQIKDSRLAAEQFLLSPNLVNYDITIGNEMVDYLVNVNENQDFENKIGLKLAGNICLGDWMHERVRSVEYMYVLGDGTGNLDFGSAHNMQSLTIEQCSTVKKLVDMRTGASVFPLLETLTLVDLGVLEEICDADDSMQSNDFKNLKELRLAKLPKLKHLWKSSISPYHVNTVSIFNKLSSILIIECHRLRSLFSLSMMSRGSCFAHLEKLKIWDCEMMEKVFLWNEKEGQTNIITTPLVFPKLKSLTLGCLPMLTSFCEGFESIEFPLLAKMRVMDCPLLKTFRSPDDHDEGDGDSLHLFCKPHKVKFGCLSKLNVSMERYLCPQIPSDFFGGLCELKVGGLKGISLFSLSRTEIGCLLQLEKLEIWRCDMMEQVILCNNEEENQITLSFPKLKSMSLGDLPRLTTLSKGIEFLLPANVGIWNCPLLETCVSTTSSTDASLHLFCQPHRVEFGRLKELYINEYDNMRSWCGQISIYLFAGVCKLSLMELNGMKSLFPCSIARNLLNVRELYIYLCEEMVRVIEDEEEDDAPLLPLFPNLKYLDLYNLPKLECFCEWRRPLQLPSLEQVNMVYCHAMVSFTSGSLSAPKLVLSGEDTISLSQKHGLPREEVTYLEDEETAEREAMEETGVQEMV